MRTFLAVLAVSAGVLAGCGDQQPGTQATPTPQPPAASSPGASSPASTPTRTRPPSPTPAQTTGTVVTTAGSRFGPILFDGTGQAIYLFDKERSTTAKCYDACADAWPPVLTTGAPQAAGEVRGALLGTTRRTDGSVQLTYAGHPLYYYAHEGKNQVLCHNVREFGGLWLVVKPTGEPA